MNMPVKFIGEPDGPEMFVPEMGCVVKTFTQVVDKSLNYHVPLEMRGDYRPTELANYDANNKYRVDMTGRMLCYAITKGGKNCGRRAVNRSASCDSHGGRLHPMDKIYKERETEVLTRYRQFLAGQLSVADLDDEELASGGFRASNGRIYKPRNIPRELAQAFTRAIYERAQAELRSHTVKAAQTVANIMTDETNDVGIRFKAAELIIERNLGKTPQVVAITGQAAYEEIFEEISGGSRSVSREKRDIIDAEFSDIETNEERCEPIEDAANTSSERPKDQVAQHDSDIDFTSGRDARLFARDEAILAQAIEIKPFEYNIDIPLKREIRIKNGQIKIRHVDPEGNTAWS